MALTLASQPFLTSVSYERAYPNKDWGAHKIKTSVITFVYILDTCAEETVI